MLKNNLKSTSLYLVLLAVLTIPLCLGLFSDHLIDAHDSMAGLIRALSMKAYMGHGQFLVRWSPGVNWGYGYPMFNFYPPFFSFISTLFFHLTQNMVIAINWTCILFWILSGFGMFLLAREYWGNDGGALSAVLYLYAPYHIIDLYIRGAFAEFSSFTFFPFLLLSILKMSRKASLGIFLLGIGSVFGLSLTHNIMSMLFFPLAVVYMFYLFIFENRSKWIIPALSIFGIGLMMSSFFWLPALLEKKYLNLGFLIGKHYDFHENFITLGELFWPLNKWSMDHISFQVGIIHSLLCLGTLICLPKVLKMNRQLGLSYIFFLSVGSLAIFLTLPYSHLLWEHIKILSFIQFPWRILTIIVFAMSFIGGSVAILINNTLFRRTFLITAGLLVISISLITSLKTKFFNNEQLQNIDNFLALGEGEYVPQWVTIPPNNPPERKFELMRGQGQLGEEKAINPVQYMVHFNAAEQSIIRFHTFYFPGWKVFINENEAKIYPNIYGQIMFIVPPGEYTLRVIFGSTPVRMAGIIISWIGAALLFLSIISPFHSKF